MQSILVDNSNIKNLLPEIISKVEGSKFIGIDIETQDDDRHGGLMKFCGYDPKTRKKKTKGKLVFDLNAIKITGFSICCDSDMDTAYYINLRHADIENNVSWEQVKPILDAKPKEAHWVAHNAEFEINGFKCSEDYDLKDVICTLQMAVSTYGPDDYSLNKFRQSGLGGMYSKLHQLRDLSLTYKDGDRLEGPLADLVFAIIGKQSTASHSYNGYIKEMAWGYGLKNMVKQFFGYEMATFEDTLGDEAHMGQLTGVEVCSYGADDAFWALRLWQHLLPMMVDRAPNVVKTFFSQENPMVPHFAEMHREGMKVNTPAIYDRRELERTTFASHVRELKQLLNEVPGFNSKPDKRLIDRENWYVKNYEKYRNQIISLRDAPDGDDYTVARQVRGAVSNAWSEDKGDKAPTSVNITHYMPMRTLLYDLLEAHMITNQGKVQSDGEARGRMKIQLSKKDGTEPHIKIIECLNKMASVDQRMKLYLTPYTQLTDPETNKLYPTVSSQLATRRMASQYPNPMQLAKRGESTYVRGFFLPDRDDHLLVSGDWSAIELVIIGELSKDPEFKKAYGQLPHADLHGGASASVLKVAVPSLTEDMFSSLKKFKTKGEFQDQWGLEEEELERLFTNLKGEQIEEPSKAYKYWRTEVGKGANFNYWYSGFLATIGERFGWTQEQTAEATKLYRDRFIVAEDWRMSTIREGQSKGYIELPDGHRRYRYEATDKWMFEFLAKWPLDGDNESGFDLIVKDIARRIQKRSFNQLVNSLVQGTCSTIAKRSTIRIVETLRAKGWTNDDFRIVMPIHDELLFSVRWDLVPEFIEIAKGIMLEHPDIFPTLALDASFAVGVTFEPWHKENAPLGQIELDEVQEGAPTVPVDKYYSKLNNDEILNLCKHLHDHRGEI